MFKGQKIKIWYLNWYSVQLANCELGELREFFLCYREILVELEIHDRIMLHQVNFIHVKTIVSQQCPM